MKVLVIERGGYDQFVIAVCANWDAVNRRIPGMEWLENRPYIGDREWENRRNWDHDPDTDPIWLVTEMEVEE